MEHPDSEQVMKLTRYFIVIHQEMKFAVVDSNYSYMYISLSIIGKNPKYMTLAMKCRNMSSSRVP